MWSFLANPLANLRVKGNSQETSQTCSDCSDDEVFSNASKDEGLECPICWESFNIVENVPYVLWCGHTLCKNCILGLQWAVLKLPMQQIKIPLFISCPWCHLLTFRLVYKGNLKFPCKNFFLLWMVESRNGDRYKLVSFNVDSQPGCPPLSNFLHGNQASNCNVRRRSINLGSGQRESDGNDGGRGGTRDLLSLYKSLDFFIHVLSKFPFIASSLLIAFFAVPVSTVIISVYFLLTVVFAVPSFLVLYFAYPTLERLVKEIIS